MAEEFFEQIRPDKVTSDRLLAVSDALPLACGRAAIEYVECKKEHDDDVVSCEDVALKLEECTAKLLNVATEEAEEAIDAVADCLIDNHLDVVACKEQRDNLFDVLIPKAEEDGDTPSEEEGEE